MRTIKFRGMSINGEWHYGNLSIVNKKIDMVDKGCYISNSVGMPFAYQVRCETIGEFTGLLDKNNKEIFEGDIIKGRDSDGAINETYKPTVVVFHGGMFCCEYWHRDIDSKANIEVIGNYYENSIPIK